MKSCFLFIAFALLCINVIAQISSVKPLKFGQEMPDITFNFFKNYPTNTAKKSEFKGKLLIIDFWNRYCSACIASFPHLQQLQDHFKDEIQIILVTRDSEKELESLFKMSKIIKDNRLPMILKDTILHSLFPFHGFPFTVWIDKNGRYYSSPEPQSNNIQNIEAMLTGNLRKLYNRPNELDSVYNETLISQIAGKSIITPIYYSVLTSDNPRTAITRFQMIKDSIKHAIGIKAYNFYLTSFIRDSYRFSNPRKVPIIVEPVAEENLTKYIVPYNVDVGSWLHENRYCFEFIQQPPSGFFNLREVDMDSVLYTLMREQVERVFHLKTFISVRPVKCMVLRRIGKADKLKTNGGEAFEEVTDDKLVIRNKLFSAFLSDISAKLSGGSLPKENAIHFIDESQYPDSPIDMVVDFQHNMPSNQSLAKYGLSIREEVRPIKCLVIKEIKF